MSRDGRRDRTDRTVESPLSATWQPAVREPAVLVGIDKHGDEEVLDELAALADSAGAEVVGRLVQRRESPDPTTFIGKGKLTELHSMVHAAGAGLVVFDEELSPAQLRNVEERLGVKVVDRTALILDIFALHARSKEGKGQVELAQLNYLLPRLRGWGEAMSRLGGGIGTRGPGETKMEVDRQHIRRRIAKLKRDMVDLGKARQVKRSGRERSALPQVALAGYTNAGKSTLMNALTDAGVLVADQLFATLDPTVRRLRLPGGRNVTLSDTVGFVRKLPHDLVEAFRSTLEEVAQAALVLHVADVSARDVEDQVAAVREVLADIGAGGLPKVLALNKADLLSEVDRARIQRRFPDGVAVSGLTGEGLEDLVEQVERALPSPPIEVELLVPYARQEVVSRLYGEAEVLHAEPRSQGTHIRARIREDQLQWAGPFTLRRVSRSLRLPG
ncbi:MAG TPA: GTPase HflX [Actinomycetota bacterium]|nr:GTPase HflX [Actinomycetota bacterium]